MTGAFGDELYCGEEDWLTDLVIEGRLRDAAREINLHFRSWGLRGTMRAGYLQRLRRRLLDAIPGGRRLRRRQKPPAWITPFAQTHLIRNRQRRHSAFELKDNLLGIRAARDSASESVNAARHGVELRHPYRDQRLVEFVLSLPAHQLYYNGCYKHILRTAMKGILPEPIRNRIEPTSLMPLYFRGVDREKAILQACLDDPGAVWRKFVHADWVFNRWNAVLTPDQDGPHAVVPWLCVSLESWYKSSISQTQLIGDKNVEPETNVA
jgi:asparagine synthetase B (glutamine-hydrolysing)